MLQMFNKRYSHVRAYHCGRPLDPAEYKTHGLRCLDFATMVELAIELFAPCGAPDSAVRAAAVAIVPEVRAGRVYLGIDWRNFTEYAGHYLLEGSELLQGIAVNLPPYAACLEVLRQRGIPTVVECDIPVDWLGDDSLPSLIQDVIQYLRFGESQTYTLDHSITLTRDLPPEYVVAHFHPRSVEDPYAGFVKVELTDGLCGWCQSEGRVMRDYSRVHSLR
jgi:hypothetical protein